MNKEPHPARLAVLKLALRDRIYETYKRKLIETARERLKQKARKKT